MTLAGVTVFLIVSPLYCHLALFLAYGLATGAMGTVEGLCRECQIELEGGIEMQKEWDETIILDITPEQGGWECHLFGGINNGYGATYTPAKGREPNRFARFMMRICFDCRWVKR
jgi:hypothetical protein